MTAQAQVALPGASQTRPRGGCLHSQELLADVACRRTGIVNTALVGVPGTRHWTLVDAGLHTGAWAIRRAAEERFGPGVPPTAIVLTHGHFDHVGALPTLLKRWDVPVFAHAEEAPFLTGRQSYPPADAGAGGGLVARLSPFFPRGPIDLGNRFQPLPPSGEVPGLPGWRWLHTPGHTPGHVSLWRAIDRTLLVGDAFVTTRQESLWSAITQRLEMHGPPRYLTSDWDAARESVRTLAALEPELVLTGHGRAVRGAPMRHALSVLARDFDRVARPR